MRKLLTILCCLIGQFASAQFYDKGVPKALAELRAQNISNVHYDLIFDIPASQQTRVGGTVCISFFLEEKRQVVLDFQGKFSGACIVNGKKRVATMRNEHIYIPAKMTKKGMNTVEMNFTCQDKALSRTSDFIYTQYAPDKAHSCFPCFDQPDIFATFTTQMNAPEGWKTSVSTSEYAIPTSLYAFIAGRFDEQSAQRGDIKIRVLHREKDAQKTSQATAIINDASQALRWMEGYTGLKYPFSEFGIIILPDSQTLPSIEHAGAIVLSDQQTFLATKATKEEQDGRLTVIGRETAKQWLGNMVTLQWTKDEDSKGLLSSYLAAKMARQQYPKVDNELMALKDNAKATVMMRMLENIMGPEQLQAGLLKFLRKYYFKQASWSNLAEVLDQQVPGADVRQFCDVWMKEKAMPIIHTSFNNGDLVVTQKAPDGSGKFLRQKFEIRVINDLDRSRTVTVDMQQPTVTIHIGKKPSSIIPNYDGRGYGRFTLDEEYTSKLPLRLIVTRGDVNRYALLLTLRDNYLMKRIPPSYFGELYRLMMKEKNPLIMETGISHMISISSDRPPHERQTLEQCIMDLLPENRRPEFRQTVVRLMSHSATSPEVKEQLRQIMQTTK